MQNDFQIYRLRRQRRQLSEMIAYESAMPAPDPVRLQELKRRRLMLKDRLFHLENAATAH